MKPKTQQVEEVKELAVIESPTDLAKPERDTKFAHESARFLVDIIKQNHWSKKLGGQSEHIQYEGWQTAGKFYGYTVKTGDVESVEIAGVQGFKAYATVVNETTGVVVGGAEAYCMRDEYNWKAKPVFQLASMAQTRAGSKALRQILGFVVALAGYSPTPAEEVDNLLNKEVTQPIAPTKVEPRSLSMDQKTTILTILGKKGKNITDLADFIKRKFNKDSYKDLTDIEADFVIKKIEAMPDKTTDLTEPI